MDDFNLVAIVQRCLCELGAGHKLQVDGCGKRRARAYGLGGQYNMGSGVSVAGLYRKYDANVTATSGQDIDLYGVNMRVRF